MDQIPKVIHYCWFGKKPMPSLALRCIESWKKHLPDYQYVLWNEETFDVEAHQYTREAYRAGKYAFVTDYVRLYALLKHGGVYMDTDVEVLKNIDTMLQYKGFTGFESNNVVPTGIIGASANHPIIYKLFSHYDKKSFIQANGDYDITPNTRIITDEFKEKGIKFNNKLNILDDDFRVFPQVYFCPIDYYTGKRNVTSDTYTIHHFAGSWLSSRSRFKKYINKLMNRVLGESFYKYIKSGLLNRR